MKLILCLLVLFVLLIPCEIKALNLMKNVEKLLDKEAPSTAPAVPGDKKTEITSVSEESYSAKGGFSLNIPAGWTVAQDELNNFRLDASSHPGVAVSVIVNDYGKDFPVEASMKSYVDTAKKEKANGQIQDYEELSLGRASGVLRVEKPPADLSDPQRITFQGYAGTIGINIVASSRGKLFSGYKETLENIVKSMKW